MHWFRKTPCLWTIDTQGRKHLTREGERQLAQWAAEGKIRRRDACEVHILDPLQAGESIEMWLIGDDEGQVNQETYDQLKDNQGHLYAVVHYQDGTPNLYLVTKPLWEKANSDFSKIPL